MVDARHAVRNYDTRQSVGFVERTQTNARHTVGNDNIFTSYHFVYFIGVSIYLFGQCNSLVLSNIGIQFVYAVF